MNRPPANGFTLIEALVAMAILAMVVLGFMGMRTDALLDSLEARNWRLARELAEEVLSELQAGAREIRHDPGRYPSERYEGFEFEVVIGEERIASYEANASSLYGADDSNDRRLWQRERDNMRMASQKGVSLDQYREEQLREEIEEENEDQVPSEDDLEEVLVIVYFTDKSFLRQKKGDGEGTDDATFKMKAKISTLALDGLTPDEAQSLAAAKGQAQPSGGGSAGGAAGGMEGNQ